MKRLLILLYSVLCTLSSFAQAKYVFYFIGDGMGANQVLVSEMYRSALNGEPLGRTQTLMTTFPYSGQVATFSRSNGITDSAAAGTCLATGSKTNNGVLGLNAGGDTLTTIAEQLKAEGWGVGIMTTVAIDHATPAAFYANVDKRNSYYEIGGQLCLSGFDFFGGAGFHYPEGKHDNKPVNLYRLAEQSGYTIAHGYQEAQDIIRSSMPESTKPVTDVDKLILIQSSDDQGARHGSNLPYAIDREAGDLTLAQIVETAILFLNDRHERFFMMVEGGMIDYACHGDDAATAIGETWDMDEAMRLAYDFYLAHPDETLIVVTADHETGGLALGNSDYTLHLDLLQYQRCSAWILSDKFSRLFDENKRPSWDAVKTLYRDNLGLWDKVEVTLDEETELKALYKAALAHKGKDAKTMYKTINSLSNAGVQLLNRKAKVGWTSWAHTASAVPVFAIGVGAERFTGWHDNTEIVPLIRRAIDQP
ncbi:MAG: alkaline phosphatase [Paludibacteraceae bacterium]|nr:alkaline phosphatase [Paludibacteraceae bacterium]